MLLRDLLRDLQFALRQLRKNPGFSLLAVGTLALGYVRELADFRGATLGLGARGAINLVPRTLEGVYGSRTPVGVAVFLRVRPRLLEGAHAMDAEMHAARSDTTSGWPP